MVRCGIERIAVREKSSNAVDLSLMNALLCGAKGNIGRGRGIRFSSSTTGDADQEEYSLISKMVTKRVSERILNTILRSLKSRPPRGIRTSRHESLGLNFILPRKRKAGLTTSQTESLRQPKQIDGSVDCPKSLASVKLK